VERFSPPESPQDSTSTVSSPSLWLTAFAVSRSLIPNTSQDVLAMSVFSPPLGQQAGSWPSPW
jgi:hypothetical protein